MNIPQTPGNYSSIGTLVNYLRQLAASISGGWNVEHKADGRHAINWVKAPFNASADFKATAGTWTVDQGDVLLYQYARLGNLVLVQFELSNTTLSAGMGNELRLRIPGGFRATHEGFTGWMWVGGASNGPRAGFCAARSGADHSNYIALFKDNVAAWNAGTNDTAVRGGIWLEIEE